LAGVGPPDVPLLPRRVRLELELERPRDLVQRPRLAAALQPDETVLRVDGARSWPPAGSYLRVDDEWLELLAAHGDEATVARARRGTAERAHRAGALVHFGQRFVREVPLAFARQEWMR
jgi:hypothetical protein